MTKTDSDVTLPQVQRYDRANDCWQPIPRSDVRKGDEVWIMGDGVYRVCEDAAFRFGGWHFWVDEVVDPATNQWGVIPVSQALTDPTREVADVAQDELTTVAIEWESRFRWLAKAMGLSVPGALALVECERRADLPTQAPVWVVGDCG